MNSALLKQNKKTNLQSKRLSLKEKFADPAFIINEISNFIKDGDFASITDLISAYISNNKKYKSQDDFAMSIGTTRQTLHRMFAHENVSLTVFLNALEKIHEDTQET